MNTQQCRLVLRALHDDTPGCMEHVVAYVLQIAWLEPNRVVFGYR